MTPRAQPKARKHVTPDEADRLIHAAGEAGLHPARDRALVSLMYHHGLRVSEALALQWHAIDWKLCRIHIARLKNGVDGTHPILRSELGLLRSLHREQGKPDSGYLFMSQRGAPLSHDMVAYIVKRAGVLGAIGMPVHPHMLRHGCGFALANRRVDTRTIQDYLGHRDIKSTVIYTTLAVNKFDGLWRE